MKQRPRRTLLRKLLLRRQDNKYLWPALIVLCIGTFLVLLSFIVWTDYRDILSGKYDKQTPDGTYIVLSKPISADEKITEQKPTLFTDKEIRTLAAFPGVQDIGLFTSAQFPVEVSLEGKDTRFATHLFLESVPDRFIDDKPIDWYWQYTSVEVPVIVSAEFLNMYNFGYAPNQGVPQLTRGTIKALNFTLEIGTGLKREQFKARVVGFSDRISSILVPESFVDYGNRHLGDKAVQFPSRIILRVADPSDKTFVQFIEDHGYVIDRELLRWHGLRTITTVAAMGIRLLALALLLIALLVFVLFSRLSLSAAKGNLQLLLQLGYNPAYLHRFVMIRYGLIVLAVMITAGVLAIVAQVRIAKLLLDYDMHVATFPSWEVWGALSVITLAILFAVNWIVVRAIRASLR